MGTAWNPSWWKEEKHAKSWERVKEAVRRDWEQTLSDVGAKGRRDLDQDVDDTLKQAAGKDVIPPRGQANAPGGTPRSPGMGQGAKTSWQDVETPMRYGFGARDQFGATYPQWNPELEGKLKGEWEQAHMSGGGAWDEVKRFVKQGFEKAKDVVKSH